MGTEQKKSLKLAFGVISFDCQLFIKVILQVMSNTRLESYQNNLLKMNGASLIAQSVNHLPAMKETGFNSLVRKIPWRRKWQSAPVFLSGVSHGQRSLAAYSPWGHKSQTRQQLKPPSPLKMNNKTSIIFLVYQLLPEPCLLSKCQ